MGYSSALCSPDNPSGAGVYNTKDEPRGLNQGINRVASMGMNPKMAGVPNFADFTQENNPFPFLPKRFLPPEPKFDIRSLVPDSVKIGDAAKNTKDFNDSIYRLSRTLRDTIDSENSLKLLKKPAIALPQFSDSTIKSFLAGQSTGNQFGPSAAKFYAQQTYKGGINPLKSFGGIGIAGDLSILKGGESYERYKILLNDKIKTLDSDLSKLNLFNLIGNYSGLKARAGQLNQQGSFNNRIQGLKGQALTASFVLPLIGGIAVGAREVPQLPLVP